MEQASEVAERVLAEASAEAAARAAQAAARAAKNPPAGWASPRDHEGTTRVGGDVEQILELLRAVRQLIPEDLQQRLAEAVRQLLLAVRALVDWYVERLEQQRTTPVEVQDIPVM